jgi:hypothetical protein
MAIVDSIERGDRGRRCSSGRGRYWQAIADSGVRATALHAREAVERFGAPAA